MALLGTLLSDGLESWMAANRRKADCGRGDEYVSLPAAGLDWFRTA